MESKGLSKLLKRVNERICELRADSLDADADVLLRVRPAGVQRADSAQPEAYLLRTGLVLLAPGHESPRGELPLPLAT